MALKRGTTRRSYRSGGVPYGETSTTGPEAVADDLVPGTSPGPVDDPSAGGSQGQGYAPDGAAAPPPPQTDRVSDLGRGWVAQEGAAGFTADPETEGAVPDIDASVAPSAPSVGIAAEPGTASEPPTAGDPDTFRGEAAYNQAVREPYGGYQGGYPGDTAPAGRPDDRRFAPAYLAWRAEQLKQLDDDYEAWCQRRQEGFTPEFEAWQRRRAVARRQGGSGSEPGA